MHAQRRWRVKREASFCSEVINITPLGTHSGKRSQCHIQGVIEGGSDFRRHPPPPPLGGSAVPRDPERKTKKKTKAKR